MDSLGCLWDSFVYCFLEAIFEIQPTNFENALDIHISSWRYRMDLFNLTN